MRITARLIFLTEGAVVFMKTHERRIQAAESGRKTLLLGN
jgi:hypothetical protein